MDPPSPRDILSTLLTGYINEMRSSGSSDEAKLAFARLYLHRVERTCDYKNNTVFYRNPMIETTFVPEEVKRIETELLNFLLKMTKSRTHKPEVIAETHCFLGMAYEFGIFGLTINLKKALSFYSIAVMNDNAIAAYRLAVCYEKTSNNCDKILAMYKAAAKLASPEALHTYGCILLSGYLKKTIDANKGILFLKMSTKMASKDYPFPFYDLASACELEDENPIIMPNDDYIFRLYEAGAILNDANCLFRLAECFCKGELNCKVDFDRSIQLYKDAAKGGHVEATYVLAKGLLSGSINMRIPVQKDLNEAQAYAQYAAARMHPGAMTLLADILLMRNERGDTMLAYFWTQASIINGKMDVQDKATKIEEVLRARNI